MKSQTLLLALALTLSACNGGSARMAELSKLRKDSLMTDSLKRFKADQVKREEESKRAEERRHERAMSRSAHSNPGSSGETQTRSNGAVGTYTNEPAADKKKGWSDAATGTVIGAGTGAIAGALIDEHHGRGAIIGGIAGGGAGYLIGRSRDRKSGRVTKRKHLAAQ